MPYIKEEKRPRFSILLKNLSNEITCKGDLAYCLYVLSCRYLMSDGANFDLRSDVQGVLDCVKQEFYRKMLAPYEDKKIKENSDINPFVLA